MARVLLTVSGTIDPAIADRTARGERPRADYIALAEALEADLVDYVAARQSAGLIGRLLRRLGGPNLLLAWVCFRRRGQYQLIFSDGEQVGIPLALLLKYFGRGRLRTRHLMIAHILSVGKKVLFFDLFGIRSHIDRFLVYATWQKRFIEQRLKVPPERVELTPFMVDAQFFSLALVQPRVTGDAASDPRPMICAVGLECRDYPTLIAAVRGLDVRVVIAAASPWSKRADSTGGQAIPDNVTVRKYSQYELRQLYADSRFVVIPLHDVGFQAGVTAILEAMAMERAVVCTRTRGQTDVVVDGETGLYVPPTDPTALRQAIERLLANVEEAERLGQAGRRRIEAQMSLGLYAERLSRSAQALLEPKEVAHVS